MGCASNDTGLNITIPVIMISSLGGDELRRSMAGGLRGTLHYLARMIINSRLVEHPGLIAS